MSKQIWKAGTLLSPVPPALVSCGTLEKPNVFTAAWTGIINSGPAMTYVSIRPERYSYGLIKESGEFVLNLTTTALVPIADFCGVKSGRDIQKFDECKLTADPAMHVAAPIVRQSPVNLECRVTQVMPLGTHDMFMAEILAVHVDDSLIDENGKMHLDKAGLAAYAHGEYFALGEKLGTFGYTVRKKPKD